MISPRFNASTGGVQEFQVVLIRIAEVARRINGKLSFVVVLSWLKVSCFTVLCAEIDPKFLLEPCSARLSFIPHALEKRCMQNSAVLHRNVFLNGSGGVSFPFKYSYEPLKLDTEGCDLRCLENVKKIWKTHFCIF